MSSCEWRTAAVRVELSKMVGVSAQRLRAALERAADGQEPGWSPRLPAWLSGCCRPARIRTEGEGGQWFASVALDGTALAYLRRAVLTARVRPVARLWSQVGVQLRYSRRPGLLGWIAAQTLVRWRLRARLRELVLDLSRCTAPAWAYPAAGVTARLRPRARFARSAQVLRAPVRAAG